MDSFTIITNSSLLILLTIGYCILSIIFIFKRVRKPFSAELRGDELIIDLLKKRLLISKHKRVYVFGNDRGIWIANAKQCLQDTE